MRWALVPLILALLLVICPAPNRAQPPAGPEEAPAPRPVPPPPVPPKADPPAPKPEPPPEPVPKAPMPKVPAPRKPPDPPVTFEELYKEAALDAAALPPAVAVLTRYFDARSFPKEGRKEAKAVVDYHVNALSREQKIVRTREVTPWLWALRIDDYGWDRRVYEDLVRVNFYHSIPVKLVTPTTKTETKTEIKKVTKYRDVTKVQQVLVPIGGGRYGYQNQNVTTQEAYTVDEEVKTEVQVEVKTAEKNDFIPAPWLPAREVQILVRATDSRVPMFRADQFVHQTAVQKDRNGHGYYDFFGFKKLADVEKFVKLDRAGAIEIYRELGAVVARSGVSLNNRQIFRLQALSGPWWETRDVDTNVGRKEATGTLLEDFDTQALEVVFRLYNGLPGFYLTDNKGAQQEIVPDFVASDQRATGNDRRIHASMSCVVCHFDGGLRPIRDWGRQIYDPERGIALGTLALDEKRSRRVESVYLGPLFKNYKRDVDDYAEAILAATDLKPPELAKAFETFWSEYLDKEVTLERAAREIGVDPKDMQETMIAYAKRKRITDTVLASYLVPDPLPVRREHFEERFGLLMLILGGANP